jgi:integrase
VSSIQTIGPDGRRLPAGSKAPKGSRYRARWRTPDGASRMKTFARKVDAERFLYGTEHAKSAGTYIDPIAGRERFSDYASRWAEAQDWKDSTRESFDAHLKRVLVHLGDLGLDQVDELVLLSLRSALTGKYATSTATISLHYACAIMRSACRTGRIARDPTTDVDPPKRRDGDVDGVVGPEQVPTRDEVLAIIAGAPGRHRAAVALGACGLRIGEVLGVTDDRLHLDVGTLRIDRQLWTRMSDSRVMLTTPKREKKRTIKLPGWARLELRRHLRDHGPFRPLGDGDEGGLLFRGGRDAPFRRDAFYDSVWHPALSAAGLAEDRFVFHSLRHWCASSMLAEGTPITAVAGHLGDTVETVSRTYAHWLRDDRDVPAAVLDRLLAPRRDAKSAARS